ncbi:hypothetical protein [Fulvivirga sedimenti]|nr:hypothetical protein [Fulvivirga sedimenti]
MKEEAVSDKDKFLYPEFFDNPEFRNTLSIGLLHMELIYDEGEIV